MSSIMQFNSLRIDIEEMSKITGIDRRTVYKAMDRWTENDQ
jgi:predicted DNA-binding transcriptional regulator AlpA